MELARAGQLAARKPEAAMGLGNMESGRCGGGKACESVCPIVRLGQACPSLAEFASAYVAGSRSPERGEVIAGALCP